MRFVHCLHAQLNHLAYYSTTLFFVLQTLLLIFKSFNFYFSLHIFVEELFILIGWFVVDLGKLFFGALVADNLRTGVFIVGFLFYIPSVLGLLFYCFWQTFITRLDRLICYVFIVLNSIQFLAHLCFFMFKLKKKIE